MISKSFILEAYSREMAVAVFDTATVQGEVCFYQKKGGLLVDSTFTRLPPGEHGFHIHRAGDLRGEGCQAACDHWHKGKATHHGGPPGHKGPRHTGDLGNISPSKLQTQHFLKHVTLEELYGRSVIVHEDEDDYGRGPHDDSKTTGHSGKRIACAVIGRMEGCPMATRKKKDK
jgi:Cu-Zn family superoxide dismutase